MQMRLVLAFALGLAAPLMASAEPDRSVKVSTPLYEFAYSYPAAAGAIPALKAYLDHDLDKTRADLVKEATQDRDQARKNHFPYLAHSSQTDWKVVTNIPGWLSLSAQSYVFSGGAHGNTAYDALLWDKSTGERRGALDLFTSVSAFKAAVGAPFCAALDRERAKRREGDGFAKDDPFSQCIDPAKDTTVILGSARGGRFTRVGFLIAPYAAGPYVEGTYEVTLVLTPAMLQAVRPEYRSYFAPG
jgi:hypothetical protein